MLMKAIVAAGILGLATGSNAAVLYSQAYDGTGNLWASQNDTTGGNGAFAAAYDDFVLTATSNLNGLAWTGGYYNPPSPGPIAGFNVAIHADASGTPGSVLASGFVAGVNETLISGPIYAYDFSFPNLQLTAGTYWLSVVPDLGFPPQWGWATSGSGSGNAYQCFFGSCGPIGGTNLAFDVLGNAVPEPATWAMMVIGFGGLGAAMRMARRRTPAVAA